MNSDQSLEIPKINETMILIVLACMNFCHILDFMIIMPLGPQLMRMFNFGPAEFGILVSSYSFSAAISGIFSAFFIDRYNRKTVVTLAFSGFIVGTALCAFAPTYHLLLIARIIAGAFGGLVGAQIFAIIGDVIPESRRGKATGIVMAAFAIASVMGVPMSLMLASAYNWHTPFFAIVGTSMIGLILCFFKMPPLVSHLQKEKPLIAWQEVTRVLKEPTNQVAFMLSAFLMMAGFTVIPFISTYLVSNVGVTEDSVKFVFLCGGIATLITSPLIGKLADKFGNYRILFITMLLSLIPIALLTNMPKTELMFVLIGSTLFMSLVSGRAVVAVNLINSAVSKSHRGRFMSINSSVQAMSSGLASLVASRIIVQSPGEPMTGYSTVGFIAMGFTISCIGIARRVSKNRK